MAETQEEFETHVAEAYERASTIVRTIQLCADYSDAQTLGTLLHQFVIAKRELDRRGRGISLVIQKEWAS